MNTNYKPTNTMRRTSNAQHNTSKAIHRVLALFLTFTVLLPSITPYNNLWANNNGPNAPEAASFEPVDATDMVNLLTGDFTYVLPLMNVPSPEGGYPIALAYHAGIAMDQEASWVGLGWNLNPGAINRSVNGYPDDYLRANIQEFYYDSGKKEEVKSLSVNYSSFGAVSVGVGLSWGTNKSLGGSVSIGVGLDLGGGNLGVSASVGTNGSSLGVGYNHSSGLSLGVSATSEGDTNLRGSFRTNDGGFRIGAATDGTYSAAFSSYSKGSNSYTGFSVGFNLSSNGVGLSLSMSKTKQSKGKSVSSSGGIGIGANNGFSNTISQSDYSVSAVNNVIPLFIPTPIGFFGLTFGKQTIQYRSYKESIDEITGHLKFLDQKIKKGYFDDNIGSWVEGATVHCETVYFDQSDLTSGKHVASYFHNNYDVKFFENNEAALEYIEQQKEFCDYAKTDDSSISYCNCSIVDELKTTSGVSYYNDIYEIPLTDNKELASSYDINKNNPVFPAYDNYNVSAQGLSGSISPNLIDAGSLQGKSIVGLEYNLAYHTSGVAVSTLGDSNSGGYIEIDNSFVNKPYFYFDNEISSYLHVAKPTFGSAELLARARNQKSIVNQVNKEDFNIKLGRLKKPNYIEYFTNWEIASGEGKSKGLLETNASGFTRLKAINNGIGAYKITSPDGKTYHYSLPVYNHETITRTFGTTINSDKSEDKGYKEKRQLTPYATHWLLTAVTGPDFIDNGDNIAGEGDLGYWVNFEYGLWSDAYVWKAPYGKDYIVDESDSNLKTWIKGRKQQYFLDKIKTRTHTALFLKSERDDNRSLEWKYSAVKHYDASWNNNPYTEVFTIPEQKTLKLDKIILIKNEFGELVSKESGGENAKAVEIVFLGGTTEKSSLGKFDLKNNVFDVSDNWDLIKSKAIKIIDFNYSDITNGLVKGAPNTGGVYNSRLSLNSVNFKGKQGLSVMPPYRFGYNSRYSYIFNIEDRNSYGYLENDQLAWSLKEIYTPQGGRIQVEYENHKFKAVLDNKTYSNGGIRVKSIATTDGVNTYKSTYKYGKNNDGLGWVSYFPFANDAQKQAPYSSELPAPVTMYEYVTHESSNSEGENIGKSVYKFHVLNSKSNNEIKFGNLFELNILRDEEHSINYWSGGGTKNASIADYEIKDNLSCIGQLLSVTSYNSEEQLMSKLENNYFTPDELPEKIGVVEESYQTYKQIDVNYASTSQTRHRYRYVNNSSRIKYPSILKSSTELKNGVSYTTTFSDFDLTSGQAKKTQSFSSTGLELKSEGIPAFYKYPSMGSKSDDITNKNMLTQGAQMLSYFKRSSADDWQLFDAEVNTWESYEYDTVKYENKYTGHSGYPDYELFFETIEIAGKDNIYRKHKTYAWKGDLEENGSYKDFVPYRWDATTQDEGWQKLSEITRYSDWSRPLETEDINGNKASNKMGDNYSKVFATSNASYDAMFYASFENKADFDVVGSGASDYAGGLAVIDGEFVANAHSGSFALKTKANGNALYIRPKIIGKYKASLWMHNSGSTNNIVLKNSSSGDQISHNPNEIVEAGDWIQLNYYFDVNQEGFFILKSNTEDIIVDDFRMLPIESAMTSYVYNEWDELECILGPNNMGVKYEYDAAGRLFKTYTEVAKNGTTDGGFKQTSETRYNYKR